MCPTGSAHAELTHGLSRMMGNHQVRFLGEGAAEMPLPYPTPACTESLFWIGNLGDRCTFSRLKQAASFQMKGEYNLSKWTYLLRY
jgi:hypothetical protein